jgi:oligoendopeptidase F
MAQGNPELPSYSQTPRAQIPVALTWKVDDLFASEAQWRTELKALQVEVRKVDALAHGWTTSPARMAALLETVYALQLRLDKLSSYASRLSDVDMAEGRYQTMKGEIQSLAVDFGGRLAFLEPDVLSLGEGGLKAALKAEKRLAIYAFSLEKILRGKAHVLPEGEQRVASMTGLFGGASQQASGLLNNVDLPRPEVTLADGTKVVLNQSNFQNYRASANADDRRMVMDAYWASQKKYENTFAALLDGAVQQHLFQARIHKFDTCLESALFENAVDPKVYHALIQAVRENLAPMHRLLKLRQHLLKLPEFRYNDIYASAVSKVSKTYSFAEGLALVVDAMAPLGKDYTDVLKRAFSERWVDIYPNAGKRSGAYSSGMYGVHPFVLMNYDGRYREVSTLAHELGHAMHSHFSSLAQPYALADYPIFLAEIASTFNECLLMDHMLKQEKDDHLKLYLLDQYLENLRGTMYRQTLFADFELAMHQRVEQGLSLTPDWLNAKYLELTRLYYGHDQGIVKVEPSIQNEWSGIPHFFYNFYVYQYATGIMASMALSDAVLKEGAPARERYLTFLKAGGSDYPLNTLKKAGVDMTDPKTMHRAFQVFDHFVGEMEAIVARLEKK